MNNGNPIISIVLSLSRLPQIYDEFYHTVNNADHDKDLRWWSNTHGVNMPMAWPQFEVGFVLALCMSFLFSFLPTTSHERCWVFLFCFVFAQFCLFLLLILFGGCRSTRRSSERSPRGRRRTWAGSPTGTSLWSTREASVTIYLYVTPTHTHRW